MHLIQKVIIFASMIMSTSASDYTTDISPRLCGVTFIATSMGLSILVRALVNAYEIPISCLAILFTIGVIFGILSWYLAFLNEYTMVVFEVNPYTLLSFVLPILVFRVSFCLDAHTFVRAWFQILLLSLPGLLLTMVFVGFMGMVIFNSDWNWTVGMGMLFGIISTPIYPEDIVKILKEIGQSKHLVILLEGEAMIGMGCAIVIYTLLMGSVELHLVTWYNFVMVFLRIFGGGLLFGYILGKISCWLVSRLYNDVISMMMVTIIASCMGFYICQDILSFSGVTCVVVVGALLSTERSSLSADVELFLVTNWELLAYMVNAGVFFAFGILAVNIFYKEARITDCALMLVTYTVVQTGRFLAFICLAPILSRVSYGLTFRHMTIIAWGGIKGCVTFCLCFIVYSHPLFVVVKTDVVIHMIGLVIITLLFNVTTMPILLKLMGMCDLSMARQANMNNCVRHVLNRRERTISMLKMDRFLADANWPKVSEATLIRHPYKINLSDSESDDEFYFGYRFTVCPDCQKEIAAEPTAKELVEMTREARMRVLKAKKISYTRQYENGMITKDSFRVLTAAVEYAMDTEEAVIELEGLHRLFARKGMSIFLQQRVMSLFYVKNDADSIRPPRKYWRRLSYHIVKHKAFDIFIYTVIALNIIPIVIELVYKPRSGTKLSNVLKLFNLIFFLIYLSEFILKILAYSFIYVCRDGFYTYLNSYWNVFDFVVLLGAATDLTLDIMDYCSASFNKSDSKLAKVTLIARMLRIIRVIRLVRLCSASYPRIMRFIDSKTDYRMAYAYDIGKGFVTGEDELSNKLGHMIDNVQIREEIRARMEADRVAITKQLGLVQRDRPWIAITVKTKQAIMTVLNSMSEAVYELKISGWVDDIEYHKLMESLTIQLKYVRTIRMVQPSPPKVIFKEVPWMAHDDEIIDFLYQHVHTQMFDPGDVICSVGEMSEGIFIIVTGLFKLKYSPEDKYLSRLAAFGELPIIDYISSVRFDEEVKDFIVSGNSAGELSVLTGRTYCCEIVADTPCQAYVLTHEVLHQAMEKSSDPIQGLAARLWKCVSTRLATSLLMSVPAYQSMRQEKIRYTLERAFVPDLTRYRVLAVNDMMEDIILIEGVVLDFNTKEHYIAPSYIPRTVQKIVLIRTAMEAENKATKLEPKLLIIPVQDVETYEIMELGEQMSEMVSTTSSRCLMHMVQHRSARWRKRRQTLSKHKVKGGPSSMSMFRSTHSGSNLSDEELANYAYYEDIKSKKSNESAYSKVLRDRYGQGTGYGKVLKKNSSDAEKELAEKKKSNEMPDTRSKNSVVISTKSGDEMPKKSSRISPKKSSGILKKSSHVMNQKQNNVN